MARRDAEGLTAADHRAIDAIYSRHGKTAAHREYVRRRAKYQRGQTRRASSTKRRAAGKVVKVRAYCRRGAARYIRSGDEGMPF